MALDFKDTDLNLDQWVFTNYIMSSDALACQILTRIKRKVPTSVIRTSDGEGSLIKAGAGGGVASWLRNPAWLKRYGMEGADLKAQAQRLLWAGDNADYLACTISGVFHPSFNTHQYWPTRTRYVDQFYAKMWCATGRMQAILQQQPVLVLHNSWERVCAGLEKAYVCKTAGIRLSSWRDHAGIVEAVRTHAHGTVLVSGGPTGKALCVELAQATGKVVLDLGETLTETMV